MIFEMPYDIFNECLHELDVNTLTEPEFDFAPFFGFGAMVFNLCDFVDEIVPPIYGQILLDIDYEFERGDDENPGIMDVRKIDWDSFRKQFKAIADEVIERAVEIHSECLRGRVSQILFYQLQKDCELYIYEKASGEIADINYEKACEG